MNCERILILSDYWKSVSLYGIQSQSLYKEIPFFLKPLRFFSLKTGVLRKLWVAYNRSTFEDKDLVILFDPVDILFQTDRISRIITWECRLVLFFWNPVSIYNDINLDKIEGRWERWTFDRKDAIRYHMKYNGQFVFDKLLPLPSKRKKYDLVFVGIDKGRFQYLFPLKKYLEENLNLSVLFCFVDKVKSLYDSRYSRYVPYAEMLKLESESQVILDFTQEGQDGLTLRVLEGLLMRKKIVTNNKSITQFNFFNKNQIFVLNSQNVNDIRQFISEPLSLKDDYNNSDYTFSSWLNRIACKKELEDRVQ